jgi:NAD(P)H-dependent FMN reductase
VELKRRIREADALLFVTPEYNFFVFLNIFPIKRPEVMISNAAARFDSAGRLTDDTPRTFIRELLRNLVDWTRQLGQRPKT